jgi:hypothetical protein
VFSSALTLMGELTSAEEHFIDMVWLFQGEGEGYFTCIKDNYLPSRSLKEDSSSKVAKSKGQIKVLE